LSQQQAFLNEIKIRNLRDKMKVLEPLFENLNQYVYLPIAVVGRTIADELNSVYNDLRAQNLIKDLGEKYDIFLRFVQSEWIDYERTETLFDQISARINDITSAISEGDLVNSSELLNDRVFIMTVYKSKGLEFENVVVLDSVDGRYPFFLHNQILSNPHAHSAEDVERAQRGYQEDARKFYVAISRAKKRLCISYAYRNANDYSTRLTPFMTSIRPYFYDGKS